MTNDISSPLYYGPVCTHSDSAFNTICCQPIPQTDKLSIIHSMISRKDTTTLRYDPSANISEGYSAYCTTFETAVARGDYDVVKHLLQAGANPDICGRVDLGPPLHVAIRNFDLRMVDILGNSGVADMNIKYKITSPQTGVNTIQQRISAQNLARRMKVPEELAGEEKEKWESDWGKTVHLVDYFVGRM